MADFFITLFRHLNEIKYPLFIFFIFAATHSIFTREEVKEFFKRVLGEFYMTHLWRFVYSLVSLATFTYFYFELIKTDINYQSEFTYPYWYTPIALLAGLFSFIYACILLQYMHVTSFYGVEQFVVGIKKLLFKNHRETVPVAGESFLVTTGPYGITRHPMMTTSFLFILCFPPVRSTLVMLILHTLYAFIGSYHEETRMERLFGKPYLDYKKEVGAIFPKFSQFKKWFSQLRKKEHSQT